MEKIGFSRRSFEEILRDAEKQFETGEVEYLLGEMEKTIVRTFGIGGIISVDKQEKRTTREIEGIRSYNSP